LPENEDDTFATTITTSQRLKGGTYIVNEEACDDSDDEYARVYAEIKGEVTH